MPTPFALDRIVVPVFYTVVSVQNKHDMPVGTVLAENAQHSNLSWIYLGYVSKQTPLGQGTCCGFPRREVRLATKEEVLAALSQDHPFGGDFRPTSQELKDATFRYTLASAFDDPLTESDPAINQEKAEDNLRDEFQKYSVLMQNWDKITAAQCKAIADAVT